MNFLLDTDTAVFWLRRNSKIRERLTPETLKTVAISIISLAELRYGANCSAHPEANHQAIDDFISGIPVLGIDQDIARTYADLKLELRKQGLLIEDLDLLIAATARAHALALVTSNAQHFQRITGLIIENWIN